MNNKNSQALDFQLNACLDAVKENNKLIEKYTLLAFVFFCTGAVISLYPSLDETSVLGVKLTRMSAMNVLWFSGVVAFLMRTLSFSSFELSRNKLKALYKERYKTEITPWFVTPLGAVASFTILSAGDAYSKLMKSVIAIVLFLPFAMVCKFNLENFQRDGSLLSALFAISVAFLILLLNLEGKIARGELNNGLVKHLDES
ncbi:hypothetical protein EX462_23900 [Vibrio alginolyticus]|nr:hypothetical protein [Vibrio alginolyticus]